MGNLTNITRSEKTVMAGKPYQELFECEEVEVGAPPVRLCYFSCTATV